MNVYENLIILFNISELVQSTNNHIDEMKQTKQNALPIYSRKIF